MSPARSMSSVWMEICWEGQKALQVTSMPENLETDSYPGPKQIAQPEAELLPERALWLSGGKETLVSAGVLLRPGAKRHLGIQDQCKRYRRPLCLKPWFPDTTLQRHRHLPTDLQAKQFSSLTAPELHP